MLRLKLNSWLEQVSSSSQSNRHLWRNSTKKHISERRRRKIVSIWDANRVSRKSPRGLSFVLLMMLSVEKRFGFEARWDGREISEWMMSFLIRVLETFTEKGLNYSRISIGLILKNFNILKFYRSLIFGYVVNYDYLNGNVRYIHLSQQLLIICRYGSNRQTLKEIVKINGSIVTQLLIYIDNETSQ